METAIEYATELFEEFKKELRFKGDRQVKSVIKVDHLECLITCTDESTVKVTGLFAAELIKRLEHTKAV